MNKSKLVNLGVALLIAVGFSMIFSSVGLANCPKQLSAYWKLDENTGAAYYADFMGGNNGTSTGANPITAVDNGVVGKAQGFDGTATTITVPSSRTFDWAQDESFSIGFWVKTTATTATGKDQVVISRYQDPTHLWYVGIDTNGHAAFIITAPNGNTDSVTGDTLIADGQWHYVVAVRDTQAGDLYLYVDGKQETNAAATAKIANPTALALDPAPITFGSFHGTDYLDGALDEMAVYDRALDASEISDAYANAKNDGSDVCLGSPAFYPFPDSTISVWHLDEDTNPPNLLYKDAFGGNDGTGTAGIVALDKGVVGKAQEFNSNDKTKITVLSHWSFDWAADESFSVEFWVKTKATAATGSDQIVIGRDLDANHLWYVGIDAAGHAAFIIHGDSGLDSVTDLDAQISDGQWHYVVAERDTKAGALYLYVDGQTKPTEAQIKYQANLALDPAPITIGSYGGKYYFDGGLDEMALYNSALSASEVNTHYQDGKDGHSVDYQPSNTGGGGSGSSSSTNSSDGGGGGGGCFISTMF